MQVLIDTKVIADRMKRTVQNVNIAENRGCLDSAFHSKLKMIEQILTDCNIPYEFKYNEKYRIVSFSIAGEVTDIY